MGVVRRSGEPTPKRARPLLTSALMSGHQMLVLTAGALWQAGVFGWVVMTVLSAAAVVGMGWYLSRSRVHRVLQGDDTEPGSRWATTYLDDGGARKGRHERF
jgi:hypothetical protein